MATATTVVLGSRRRSPSPPVVERSQFPLRSLAISMAAHVALAAGLIAGAAMWKASQPKIIVVNLVPAVPALGTPRARPTPTPSPTPAPVPRVTEEPPRRVNRRAPERRSESPERRSESPELPARPPEPRPRDMPREVARETSPAALPPRPEPPAALPPREAPRELPTRQLASRELPPPDRPLPPRPLAQPRPGEKELPPIPRPEAPRPLPVLSRLEPRPAVSPPPPPPREVAQPARGLPGGSPAGSGTLALRTDGNFQFNWYFQELQRRINEKWRPPGQSVHGQRVVILFELARSGQVLRSEVEESSGNFLYDQAALRAVTESGPFRELPSEFTERSIRIHLGFEFTNRG
jgi:protein TonB